MSRGTSKREAYDWMLSLSAEGWAWEYLRRNAEYRHDYFCFVDAHVRPSAEAAMRWGLLQFVNPDIDARCAPVFWRPATNLSVLSLFRSGDWQTDGLEGIECSVTVLEPSNPDVHHVLYSCEGRFLQLAITSDTALYGGRFMVDALPEQGKDRKLATLKRLADLALHKQLRPHLYGRQRRGPRLAHIAEIMDSHARNPAHRSIAGDVFGKERTDSEWDNLRDHVRRAVFAGRRLVQGGYLDFLS
jgi:hypothetical protein